MNTPTILITMGDVAGVGPEIIAKAWPSLVELGRVVVVGDADWLRTGFRLTGSATQVDCVDQVAGARSDLGHASCLRATQQDLKHVRVGAISAAAGRAAYDFLCRSIDLTLAGEADAIVTAPLQKEGLHAAGLNYPGHTEILADRTGTREFGMMLYARGPEIPHGLGVLHVTLHRALREVFDHITTAAVREKIDLLQEMMTKLCDHPPRLAVAALNPHGSDGGLFGDEEETILRPAVQAACAEGVSVSGPWPSDTLFVRARKGEFDGIVAMYHDQGHIPLKLMTGMFGAVNISVGLPIIRTSVAHGTAYDIAGRGIADCGSLVEATRVAVKLAKKMFFNS